MAVPADTLRTHLNYQEWADLRLLEAAARLTPAELTHDFGTADHSIIGTLVHLYVSSQLWLARFHPATFAAFVIDRNKDFPALQQEWPLLHDRWREWADGATDVSVQEPLVYTDLKGRKWTQPYWQLVLHVVNHSTHHRGQISGFLRSLGHIPPPLDLVAYYRAHSLFPD